MVRAIPINSSGVQVGEEKAFSDLQWGKMVNHFGKNLAWKQVNESTKKIKEIHLIADLNNEIVSTKKAKSKKKNEE